MTLLRSPRWPDPEADIGDHELAFAIFPHARRLAGRRRHRRGAALQRAAAARRAATARAAARGSRPTRPAWSIDTVKRAEDGDDLIVRLYEAHGGRGAARLRVGVPFAEAWFTNLLEDRLAPAEVDGDEVVVPYRPFEIVTLALA